MRIGYAVAVAAVLMAAAPAVGQVIIQTPGNDSARHEERAQRERWEAHQEREDAQRRAAMGDYQGAAEADREARRDWQNARRQDYRAREESGSSVVIGR
jgi:hypothetical protein